jgi:hypothetical protein
MLSQQPPSYQQALQGFRFFNPQAQGMLSAPLYPMAYNALSQYFGNLGMDPHGNSVRQAMQGPQLSRAEQMRQQWEEQQAVDAEQKRQTDAWKDKHQASMNAWGQSGGKAAFLGGMSPSNQGIWSLMYKM